ncbi:uncharacterized protein LOC129754955 [Uranotaenia lowii]|uniref:uncharacterized protein LOC129754955 n=1 Tax=Uranotaenia lowii TaxID=190385 RepID=UPI0024787A86|nr:uncharacterized protein LOC129754955 [Uranotaenia lowii]
MPGKGNSIFLMAESDDEQARLCTGANIQEELSVITVKQTLFDIVDHDLNYATDYQITIENMKSTQAFKNEDSMTPVIVKEESLEISGMKIEPEETVSSTLEIGESVVNESYDYESPPEDMSGFEVIDEAEITDVEDLDEEDDGKSRKEECPYQWLDKPWRRGHRIYTLEDFTPTEVDPRCSPDWPLATYWPVYVGNFKIFKKCNNDRICATEVHVYFASKGLPSFMVFRLKDDFYEKYQLSVGLFDMLVYFCNQEDANRAIKWCNRDVYKGHRLNVFDGRTESYFPLQNSWRVEYFRKKNSIMTETKLENIINNYGQLKCITKHEQDGFLINLEHTSEKFLSDFKFKVPIFERISKQRFVERMVITHLRQEIDEGLIMQMKAPAKYLRPIMHGIVPQLRKNWTEADIPQLKNFQSRAPKFQRFCRTDIDNGSFGLATEPQRPIQRRRRKRGRGRGRGRRRSRSTAIFTATNLLSKVKVKIEKT